jgi:hypothetical protein
MCLRAPCRLPSVNSARKHPCKLFVGCDWSKWDPSCFKARMFRLPVCALGYRLRVVPLRCISPTMAKSQAKPRPGLTRVCFAARVKFLRPLNWFIRNSKLLLNASRSGLSTPWLSWFKFPMISFAKNSSLDVDRSWSHGYFFTTNTTQEKLCAASS